MFSRRPWELYGSVCFSVGSVCVWGGALPHIFFPNRFVFKKEKKKSWRVLVTSLKIGKLGVFVWLVLVQTVGKGGSQVRIWVTLLLISFLFSPLCGPRCRHQ